MKWIANAFCVRLLYFADLSTLMLLELFDIIEPKNLETFETLYVVLELAESDLKKLLNLRFTCSSSTSN